MVILLNICINLILIDSDLEMYDKIILVNNHKTAL